MNNNKQVITFAWKDVLGIVLSVLFLLIVAKNIHYELLVENFEQMKFWTFGICLLLHVAQTMLLGIRWTLLFSTYNTQQTLNAIPSYWIGNFYNNLLPGRLGDIVKAWHFSTKHQIPFSNTFAAVLVEKIVDVQALGFFSCVYLVLFNLNIPLVSWIALLCIGMVITANIVLLVIIKYGKWAKFIFGFIPIAAARHWLYGFFLQAADKLKTLFRSKNIFVFFSGSLAVYLVGVLTTYLLFITSGLAPYFGSLAVCVAFPIFFLVIHFIPSAPSSIGVVHYGIYKALLFLAAYKGLTITDELENQIIFSTLLFHFVYFIPETGVGLYFVFRERGVLFSFQGVNYFLKKRKQGRNVTSNGIQK